MRFDIYDIADGFERSWLRHTVESESEALEYVLMLCPSFWSMPGGGVIPTGQRHYENSMIVYEKPGGVRHAHAVLLVIPEDSEPPYDFDRIRRTFTNDRWRLLPSQVEVPG